MENQEGRKLVEGWNISWGEGWTKWCDIIRDLTTDACRSCRGGGQWATSRERHARACQEHPRSKPRVKGSADKGLKEAPGPARKGSADEGLKEAAGVGARADRRGSSTDRGGCRLHQVRRRALGCHYEEFSRILLSLVRASFRVWIIFVPFFVVGASHGGTTNSCGSNCEWPVPLPPRGLPWLVAWGRDAAKALWCLPGSHADTTKEIVQLLHAVKIFSPTLLPISLLTLGHYGTCRPLHRDQ